MNVTHWFQEKWGNRVCQFGLRAALAQVFRAALRPLWQMKCDLVLAIPNHQPEAHSVDLCARDMTVEVIEVSFKRGELDERQRALLQGFLVDGCKGFLAEVGGRLAGYAFNQPGGTYVFGGSGRFQIPEGMTVLKNLLVFPEFRGHSLGKKLNQTRLDATPKGHVPVGFVIIENRYAIRNLKLFGFEEMLVVTRTTWFRKWTRQRIKVLNNCDLTHPLIQGLESKQVQ